MIFGIYAIFYLAGLFDPLGIEPVGYQHNGIVLAILSIFAIMMFPAKKGKDRPHGITWYDLILILFAIIPLLYLVIFYRLVMDHIILGFSTNYEAVMAVIVFIALLEAIRRTVGLGLSIIVLFFLVYPMVGNYMPGVLQCPNFDFDRIVYQMYLTSDGILGMPVAVIASIVIAFIFFGQVLQSTGGGRAILNFTYAVLGQFRGGPAKGAVVASGLFGSISGSTIANVATTGAITIPMMKQMGFKREFAGAVETVASNGGQLLPPIMGALAFLMAQVTGIPYITVCYHAFLGAILYYIIELVIVDRESANINLSGIPKSERPDLKKSLSAVWIYLIPVLLLVYLLAVLRYSVGKSGLWATALMAVITLFRKETRLSPQKILDVFKGSARSLVIVTMACAGAGIIVGSLTLTALGANFSMVLVDLSGGSLMALLLYTAIACFIFGMVGSGIAAYLALAPLICPALIEMGVPLVAAHLFVLWWACTAYITPPVAIGVFAANAIAGGSVMKTGWWAVRLGAGTFIIPFMFVYNPALVMLGSAKEITLATITALIGMAALATGILGYLLHKVNWVQRILLLVGGLSMAHSDLTANLVGFIFIVVALSWELITIRRLPSGERT